MTAGSGSQQQILIRMQRRNPFLSLVSTRHIKYRALNVAMLPCCAVSLCVLVGVKQLVETNYNLSPIP